MMNRDDPKYMQLETEKWETLHRFIDLSEVLYGPLTPGTEFEIRIAHPDPANGRRILHTSFHIPGEPPSRKWWEVFYRKWQFEFRIREVARRP